MSEKQTLAKTQIQVFADQGMDLRGSALENADPFRQVQGLAATRLAQQERIAGKLLLEKYPHPIYNFVQFATPYGYTQSIIQGFGEVGLSDPWNTKSNRINQTIPPWISPKFPDLISGSNQTPATTSSYPRWKFGFSGPEEGTEGISGSLSGIVKFAEWNGNPGFRYTLSRCDSIIRCYGNPGDFFFVRIHPEPSNSSNDRIGQVPWEGDPFVDIVADAYPHATDTIFNLTWKKGTNAPQTVELGALSFVTIGQYDWPPPQPPTEEWGILLLWSL